MRACVRACVRACMRACVLQHHHTDGCQFTDLRDQSDVDHYPSVAMVQYNPSDSFTRCSGIIPLIHSPGVAVFQ